ncbi:(2Fe-2S)-binding protein [Amorphus orientalis]|uniref:Bacterioferritin-associated ferredoxin n=1 Tax=Amorphus orientalis TaxID=649198 RepID=A0AAE3VJM3_9HYPH|nr:(2Fe-2S)-binding protein [Amorphus orientalis]MDQ0313569.1 bacterioferritin-associated ferredoxin [Amorphus orientalis]
MIVCSCNALSHHDIREAVSRVRAVRPVGPITVGQLYRALGKRPKCGNCLSHATEHARLHDTAGGGECCKCPGARCWSCERVEAADILDVDGAAA